MTTMSPIWCIHCDNLADLNENCSFVMKTAYKLTERGPVPFGECSQCLEKAQHLQVGMVASKTHRYRPDD